MRSDDALSSITRQNRPVGDVGLRKMLNDPNISEHERMEAVMIRTQQIEKKAELEE